ncbi:MAG: serine hydrolase domain-containing protein, partial [Planctomycetaceae bacterium]
MNRAASLVEHAVEDDEIPAAVIFVACQGEVVLHRAFGFRDAARTQPLQENALFRMASNSKAVTAAGILLLVQDGQLQLDDPVAKFLPAFANETWNSVTVRHLLTHTSGCRIKPLFLKPLLSFDSQAA